MKLVRRIRLFITVCGLVTFGLGIAAPVLVNADTIQQPKTAQQTVCQALSQTDNCAGANPNGSLSINGIIRAVVNIFSFVIGVTAVIMIMVGGFRYINSGGDSSKVASARSTITYAVIGLVVTALAQGLVRFVLHKV